ncbi:DNA gyrase inhibitor [termite gut metagenome]|uniref:DNA gyrase inhibitor n=1 Tax=termite gut metagenome TaxID=433724 RepID=A0A5J4RHL7_9ZZZZ
MVRTIQKRIIIEKQANIKTLQLAPKLLTLEPKQAIYLNLTGDYQTLDFCSAWNKLWQYVKENKLFSAGIEHIVIYHDDPKVTEADKLRTDICLVLPKKAVPKGEIGVKTIEGGKYAMFLYQGSYEHLSAVYDTIHTKWLPESGEKLRNYPCFEKYLNHPDNTALEKLKTEIYIPIE